MYLYLRPREPLIYSQSCEKIRVLVNREWKESLKTMGISTVSLFSRTKMQNLSWAFVSMFPFSWSFGVGVFYKQEKWKWQSLILESRREFSKARQGHPSTKKHKLWALYTQLFHLKSKLPVYSRNNTQFLFLLSVSKTWCKLTKCTTSFWERTRERIEWATELSLCCR